MAAASFWFVTRSHQQHRSLGVAGHPVQDETGLVARLFGLARGEVEVAQLQV